MPATITDVSLCICRHVYAHHPGDAEACRRCACKRFQLSARTSSSHYRRGMPTLPKRVARLQPGDVVLVGFPGFHEIERGPDGEVIWEQRPGEVTSHPRLRHVQDYELRPAVQKTGALLARVTSRDLIPGKPGFRRSGQTLHVIHTDLGDLVPLHGVNSVSVVLP